MKITLEVFGGSELLIEEKEDRLEFVLNGQIVLGIMDTALRMPSKKFEEFLRKDMAAGLNKIPDLEKEPDVPNATVDQEMGLNGPPSPEMPKMPEESEEERQARIERVRTQLVGIQEYFDSMNREDYQWSESEFRLINSSLFSDALPGAFKKQQLLNKGDSFKEKPTGDPYWSSLKKSHAGQDDRAIHGACGPWYRFSPISDQATYIANSFAIDLNGFVVVKSDCGKYFRVESIVPLENPDSLEKVESKP